MSDFKTENPTGVIDGTNKVFQVDNKPKYIVLEGIQYFEGDGYEISKIVVTMVVPPAPGSTLKSVH